jgi:hypothetical protein
MIWAVATVLAIWCLFFGVVARRRQDPHHTFAVAMLERLSARLGDSPRA